MPVLHTGESGTGKELAAHLLHYSSERRLKPFIKVNCAAIPDTMLESELFGHEKGAFADARKTHKGKFELAHNGTIFLDEIGNIRELKNYMERAIIFYLFQIQGDRIFYRLLNHSI